jgi:hypothetical protein
MTTTPDTHDDDTTDQVAMFSTWLHQYGAGALDDKLTAALAEVAQACRLLDKSGSLTLTLKITPTGDGVTVLADHAMKKPEAKPGGAFFYVATDGSLTTRHPSQPALPDVGTFPVGTRRPM